MGVSGEHKALVNHPSFNLYKLYIIVLYNLNVCAYVQWFSRLQLTSDIYWVREEITISIVFEYHSENWKL